MLRLSLIPFITAVKIRIDVRTRYKSGIKGKKDEWGQDVVGAGIASQ